MSSTDPYRKLRASLIKLLDKRMAKYKQGMAKYGKVIEGRAPAAAQAFEQEFGYPMNVTGPDGGIESLVSEDEIAELVEETMPETKAGLLKVISALTVEELQEIAADTFSDRADAVIREVGGLYRDEIRKAWKERLR